jgi:hypothetical protein
MWLWQNKDWIFSGIGVVFLGWLALFIKGLIAVSAHERNIKVRSESGAFAAAAPVVFSPVPTGSNISQNSPTVQVRVPPEHDLPDVLLKCDWSAEPFGIASTAPLIPGIHTVRNRLWSLRHPGNGVVYSSKLVI